MDALSDVLRVAHLTGGVFLHAEFFEPWCIAARVSPEHCTPILGPASHLIIYHYVVEGEIPDAVGRLKQESDQNFLIYGSGALLNTLLHHDLVDLCRLMIYPVVLGQGKRLFTESSTTKPFRLADVTSTSTGAS